MASVSPAKRFFFGIYGMTGLCLARRRGQALQPHPRRAVGAGLDGARQRRAILEHAVVPPWSDGWSGRPTSQNLSNDDLAAGVMLASVVGTQTATSCHRRGAGGPI
jgi:hypothetical protein